MPVPVADELREADGTSHTLPSSPRSHERGYLDPPHDAHPVADELREADGNALTHPSSPRSHERGYPDPPHDARPVADELHEADINVGSGWRLAIRSRRP